MELEFDKEIDALMRERRLAGRLATGKSGPTHLDADELSAFAENAMPEKSRRLYLAHLADCDRCREILSNLIVSNSEAGVETATVVAPATSAAVEPWYRRLFFFPNLAYLMGGLVLVFGGLLGISFLQSSIKDSSIAMSQATETRSENAPIVTVEQGFSNSANSATNSYTFNAAPSANSNAMSANIAPEATPGNPIGLGSALVPKASDEEASDKKEKADITLDGVDAGKLSAATPPSPKSLPLNGRNVPKDDDLALKRTEKPDEQEKVASVMDSVSESKKREADMRAQKEAPASNATLLSKAKSGPSRENQQQIQNRANNSFEMVTRKVGGKDFQFRDNVWYDSTYRGQATTNIRRRSDEYKKLDSGLRAIAESLGGVVVVVRKDRAYRIQ